MKFKSAYFLSAAVALLAFCAFYPPVNNEEKEAVLNPEEISILIHDLSTDSMSYKFLILLSKSFQKRLE